MPAHDAPIDPARIYRKITWRLIPYLFFLFILAYLDRVNVGFAALPMKHDLGLSNTVYGTGAGIFFLGYALFDLPSNLILVKVGARRWIARIMISWGVIATGMAFITGPHSFYLLRFLLGIGEAGFFPGIILYLTLWFPSHVRAKAIAKFMIATSLAGLVGGPLSSFLLNLDGRAGYHGWQWLFLAEGVPTILVGISVLFILRDGPQHAPWLTAAEKSWLADELLQDRITSGAHNRHALRHAFRLPMLWLLGGIYFITQVGVYTVNLWMPLILAQFAAAGSLTAQSSSIARLSTLPYLAAAICTVLVGWSSDRTRDRRWHIAACLTLSAIGFAWAAFAHSLPTALVAMTLGAIGYWSCMPPFWVLPTRVTQGRAAAGVVSIIMICGGIGGFSGPYLTGKLRDLTHGYSGGLLAIAALTALGAVLCTALPPRSSTVEKM